MGFSYDWSREIDTTDPKYFRWTQWIFLKLYEKGLAYVAEAPVWYCPALGTVLANEEILNTAEGPRSERGSHPVERRPMRQWMLKITAYAERLLQDLDLLEWPDSLKEMQRNWIGKSEGAEVDFLVEGTEIKIPVYTTRPDTLFGATYAVLAPEHPLVASLTSPAQKDAVDLYRRESSAKSDLERVELAKTKSGVPLGTRVINPVNGEAIPLWVADYVLASYGTGAVMAVPAHDERDHQFALTFRLPIRAVIQSETGELKEGCFTKPGIQINSGFLDGLKTEEATSQIVTWLETNHHGRRQTRYKLRDWLFSRQRYWGEPFPILWQEGKHSPLAATDLPLTLPELIDYQPSPTGEPPLTKAKAWGLLPDGRTREVNTMPQWAGSCWYYLRFCDPQNDQAAWSSSAEKYWMSGGGVDLYVGGAEHAVLHLLYARFWHKVLFDLGLVSHPEPFRRLVNQGIILGEDGCKMSKSVGNVVNPDDIIERYGADTLRLYEMFLGPLEQFKPWNTNGIDGVYKFLRKLWNLYHPGNGGFAISETPASKEELKILHKAIKKLEEDMANYSFNTSVSSFMICVNELTTLGCNKREVLAPLAILISPYAPHIAEELWSLLGHTSSIMRAAFPEFREEYLVESNFEYPVMINGKLRAKLDLPLTLTVPESEKVALADVQVQKWLEGKSPKKVIIVPGKIVNLVV